MQAKIETLKAKNSADEEYLVYPRTLIKCVTNEHGDNLQDLISDTILEADGRVYVDYGSHEETDDYVPVDADTLDGKEAGYYATAESVADIVDGTTVVSEATKSTFDSDGNNIADQFTALTDGTTPVGNALQLGGKGASEYALANGDTTIQAVGKNWCIAYPKDGILFANTVSTGRIKIEIPVTGVSMFSFDVYINNMYGGGTGIYRIWAWTDYTTVQALDAYSITGAHELFANLQVNGCVVTGDTSRKVFTIGADTSIWQHYSVTIRNIQLSYNTADYESWNDGWKLSIGTADDLTVIKTVENPFIGANYLHKTGGDIKLNSWNALRIVRNALSSEPDKFSTLMFADNDGNRGGIGYYGTKAILLSADGASFGYILYSNNVGSYALPITGGTITNAILTPLSVNNSHADATGTYIGFLLRGVAQGYIGVANGALKFTKDGIAYDLHHNGNMPNGSYSGTGATRTVSTGGVGQALLIRQTANSNEIALVTNHGGFYKNGTTVTGLTTTDASFQDGTLTVSAGSKLNTSGVGYYYTVL